MYCVKKGKKGKSYFIWLVLKFPNSFKMSRFFMVQIKRSYIFPKAACVSDHCFIANENCPKERKEKKMAWTVFNLLQKLYTTDDKYLSKLIFNGEIFSIYLGYVIYDITV